MSVASGQLVCAPVIVKVTEPAEPLFEDAIPPALLPLMAPVFVQPVKVAEPEEEPACCAAIPPALVALRAPLFVQPVKVTEPEEEPA